jgi:hypothetical protein
LTCTAIAAGHGIDTGIPEDFPNRRRRDLDPEGGQFAVEAPVTPVGVLIRQADDQLLDAANGGRPTGPFRPGCHGVSVAEEVAVPAQDGVRGDDQVQLPQRWPG